MRKKTFKAVAGKDGMISLPLCAICGALLMPQTSGMHLEWHEKIGF